MIRNAQKNNAEENPEHKNATDPINQNAAYTLNQKKTKQLKTCKQNAQNNTQ